MRYFYKSGEWIKERRLDNFFINKRRKTDVKAKYFGNSISNSFSILGIFFEIKIKPDVKLVKVYGPKKSSIIEVQNYVNDVKQEFYLLAFEDSSLVVYKDEKINLFKSEKKLLCAKEELMKTLDKIGAEVSLQLLKISPDF